jgi:serine/threonine protein phosphatase PrpC
MAETLPDHITAASAQGQRAYMEDFYLAQTFEGPDGPYDMLAVMDGHGGRFVASRLQTELPRQFQASLNPEADYDLAIERAAYNLNRMTNYHESGSTLTVAILPHNESHFYAGIIGDSPLFVVNAANEGLWVAPEHNVATNLAEREAAEKRGAHYRGGYLMIKGGGLQLARTLGDRSFGRILNREPEICAGELEPDSIVILGSDGLFNNDKNAIDPDLRRIAKLAIAGASASELVTDALERATEDNVTAIVRRPLRQV